MLEPLNMFSNQSLKLATRIERVREYIFSFLESLLVPFKNIQIVFKTHYHVFKHITTSLTYTNTPWIVLKPTSVRA